MVLVRQIKVAAVDPTCFQRFNNVGAMLFAALVGADHGRLLFEPVGEIGLEPVAPFGADAQITTRLTVDPTGEIDPVVDLFRALAIPGHIFADVAVGFGGVVAKAADHVDAHLFGLAVLGMRLEEVEHHRCHIHAAPLHLDVPGLVIDAGADNVHIAAVECFILIDQPFFLCPQLNTAGDLPVPALHAVTEANGRHAAIAVTGPDIHRHWVGIVKEKAIRLGHFADIIADREQCGDGALTIHNAAGAQGVTDTLVNAIFQRNVNVKLEGAQPTLADHRNDIVGVDNRLALIGMGRNCGREIVGGNVALRQLRHHIEVGGVDIHKGKVGISQFGDS